MNASASMAVDATAFAIGFDERDRARLHALWDEVLDSGRWTEGPLVERLECDWERHLGAPACAFAGWSGAALAALDYAAVRGEAVLCPSNTFMATPLAILAAGGRPVFVDCNREDLCASAADLERQAEIHHPRAAFVVHIGGHIAFEIEAVAELCRARGIFLIEDCAHAHGASWEGRRAGTWGDAGVYSLYATKTISTGEGGILTSSDPALIDFARAYRNYGKPDYKVHGLGLRMSDFTAALGIVQLERLDEIVAWKNEVARRLLDPIFGSRVALPPGMVSGHYKYVVYEPIKRSTGRVYDESCHRILGSDRELPNTDWVAANHSCVPLYYHGPELPTDPEPWERLKKGVA
jgi:dTDP-4-amino-4,6-dideoxygalactose transaminase